MTLTREQQELLEAYGFDLLVQVEAMLRHVREYQQALQRFRGTLPPPKAGQTPIATMGEHVRVLRERLRQFDICLTEIEESFNATGDHAAQLQHGSGRSPSASRSWRDPSSAPGGDASGS
jgi:hypothetical protein